MSKDKQSSSITPEMRERLRIMSRMTPAEKKAYKWKCYDEKAKPKLLKLIEYCQSDNRIFPYTWGKIYNDYAQFSDRHNFTEYPPFRPPLILGASSAPDIEKRQRLLTQIYWCYKNLFIDSVYNTIMKTPIDDWEIGHHQEDKISLELIKKEYAIWLGVKYHPEHDIWNHCTNYDKNRKQIERAEEINSNQEDVLDDESNTLIESR